MLHLRAEDGAANPEDLVEVTYEIAPNLPRRARPESAGRNNLAMPGPGFLASTAHNNRPGLPALPSPAPRLLPTGGGGGEAVRRTMPGRAKADLFEPGDSWHSPPVRLNKGLPVVVACRRILAHMNMNRPVKSAFEETVFVLRNAATGEEVELDKYSQTALLELYDEP